MPTFIKSGLWIQRKIGYPKEFNLTKYIKDLIAATPVIGSFIPLTGTTVGNPVTGDIDFGSFDGDGKSLFGVDGNNKEYGLRLGLISSPANNYTNAIYGESPDGSLKGYNGLSTSSEPSFEIYNITNNESTALTLSDGYLYFSTNNTTSRGISGAQNFSPNITDLDYTQKIYVDKAQSYFTTETLTGGKWIDGRLSYRRVLPFTTVFPNVNLNTL